jgi:biopolymer transport protein TolR
MGFGRLERTAAHQPLSDINVTPLVDVMLVLVVILIITAPLLVGSVKVDLPKTESTVAGDAQVSITLTVDRAGDVYVNEQKQTSASLAIALKEIAAKNPVTEVQLRADALVPYGRMVEVMALAQNAGLNRIGFVTEVAGDNFSPKAGAQ